MGERVSSPAGGVSRRASRLRVKLELDVYCMDETKEESGSKQKGVARSTQDRNGKERSWTEGADAVTAVPLHLAGSFRSKKYPDTGDACLEMVSWASYSKVPADDDIELDDATRGELQGQGKKKTTHLPAPAACGIGRFQRQGLYMKNDRRRLADSCLTTEIGSYRRGKVGT